MTKWALSTLQRRRCSGRLSFDWYNCFGYLASSSSLALSVDNSPSYMLEHRNSMLGTNKYLCSLHQIYSHCDLYLLNGSHFNNFLWFGMLGPQIAIDTSFVFHILIYTQKEFKSLWLIYDPFTHTHMYYLFCTQSHPYNLQVFWHMMA